MSVDDKKVIYSMIGVSKYYDKKLFWIMKSLMKATS